jgi:hypothetical protein
MQITPEMLLEACIPLGDSWHPRETKRDAVRRVMLDGSSYRKTAREIPSRRGRTVRCETVIGWVRETEQRMRIAGAEALLDGGR